MFTWSVLREDDVMAKVIACCRSLSHAYVPYASEIADMFLLKGHLAQVKASSGNGKAAEPTWRARYIVGTLADTNDLLVPAEKLMWRRRR